MGPFSKMPFEMTSKIPEGKYYLADAGFGSCDALLVAYHGVHYHLREWSVAKDR